MLRLVLKPLLVLLTLGALVVALFQVGGRILFTFLEDLEPAVNQLLASRDIRVTGLSGDWRMLNPILHADRVEFPAGYLDGLAVEVDMVASALRSAALARRLKVDDLRLELEKPEGQPWQIVGGDGDPVPDPLPFLRHSSQLELAGTVVLTREGLDSVELAVSYLGINRGGEHRHTLSIVNSEDDCPDACQLQADLYSQPALWPLRPGRARVAVRSAGFLLPKNLLGLSPLKLAEVDLDWQQNERESGGRLTIAAEQFDLPGDLTLAMHVEGSMRGRGAIHRGVVSELRVQQGDEVWQLPNVGVHANAKGVSLWMPQLDLERTSQFLRQALAGLEPAELWLTGLNIRGRAHNLRAHLPYDGGGIGYALTVDRLALDGFRGAPAITNGAGALFGFEHGVQFNLNAQGMSFSLPELFHDRWQLPYAQGVLQAWFSREYFGLRGSNLRAEALGSRAAGSFALTRPHDKPGQRLLLLVSTDQLGVAEAKQFVPYKLPDALRNWLADGPLEGRLSGARLAYQGQLQVEPGELGRRLELAARVDRGRVRYHPDWPEVNDVTGRLAVMGPVVQVDVEAASSAGATLANSQVRLLDNGAAADVILDASLRSEEALALIRSTPLQNWLGFVQPDWQTEGPIRLSGDLRVPLGRGAASRALPYDLAVRLRADLDDVQVDLPGYRTSVEGLRGTFRYRYPFELSASGVRGTMFDAPVIVSANSAQGRMNLRFAGRAHSDDVWRLLDMSDPGLATGSFDYQAHLAIAASPEQVTELHVSSPLDGLALALPAGYGKAADAVDELEVRLRLAARDGNRALASAPTAGDATTGQEVRFRYRDVAGWMQFDGAPLRGAIGFDASPPAVRPGARELVLGGRMAGFALADLTGLDAATGDRRGLPLSIRFDDLEVDAIAVGSLPITAATLRGAFASDGFDLAVTSRDLTGSLRRGADGPISVVLEELNLPRAAAGEPAHHGIRPATADAVDPLNPALIAHLPAADVELQRLMLGDEDYGRWRFQVRPEGDVVHVRELEAEVRGVRIAAPDGLQWHGATNETHFEGVLTADNLATVLPQWGYASTLETDSAGLTAAFVWAGSPASVNLLKLRGRAEARAAQGRFLDVDATAAGAQRIFSLLNFTAIAKRMSFNFSDVFGRGISFDKLRAPFSLDEGLLEFVEPLQVDGTGSSFRITGTVDLRERLLDNDMVVTLPVSKGLPWYAAYVALANPLAGIGMLVGERVLRKPLEQFSSANYRIGGTLDDPDVRFVSVFDVSTNESAVAAATRAEARADAEARAAAEAEVSEQEPPTAGSRPEASGVPDLPPHDHEEEPTTMSDLSDE